MSSEYQFLADIDVTDSITKYISTGSYQGNNNFYSPEVKDAPRLELRGKGYVSNTFGSLVLVHDPYKERSVFNFKQGTWPYVKKAYPITVQWGEQAENLFTGSAVIREIKYNEIVMDILKPEFSENLLELTLDLSAQSTVSFQKAFGGEVLVNLVNHGFDSNNQIIFESLSILTGLNYNVTTNPNKYSITVLDADTFTLGGTDGDDFSLTGSPTVDTSGVVGIPVLRPMAFGNVSHRLPILKSNNTLSNPHLDPEKIIRVYEDGVQIGAGLDGDSSEGVSSVSAGTTTTYTVTEHDYVAGDILTPYDVDGSNQFNDSQFKVAQTVISITPTTITTDLVSTGFTTTLTGTPKLEFTNNFSTVPSTTLVTLNNDTTGGELSISGSALNALNLSTLYSYFASKESLTVNTDKSSNAVNQAVAIYQESQIKVIDLADTVAQQMGYQFYISGTVLYLIDLLNDPSSSAFNGRGKIAIREPAPVQRVQSIYDLRVPFNSNSNKLGTLTKRAFVNSDGFNGVGTVVDFNAYLEDAEEQRLVLINQLAIIERSLLTLQKTDIDFNTKIGDKISFTDSDKFLNCVMYIREILHDTENSKTTFNGDGIVSTLIQG